MRFRAVAVSFVVTLLAACGGGGNDPAPGQSGLPATATVAKADPAACATGAPDALSVNGACLRRFKDMAAATPPVAAVPRAAAMPQGAAPKSGKPPRLAAPIRQAAGQPLGTVPTLTSSALFSWVSSAYSQYFWGSYFDDSIYLAGYGTFYYRYYYSGNIIAVLDQYVYVYGALTGYEIWVVDTLSSFTCYVYDCGSSGGSGSLTVGSYVNGTVGYGSTATSEYSVYLTAGTTYTFELKGSYSGYGTLGDPYLNLYNPYGSYVTYDDDSGDGNESRIVHTATYTGYYTLVASDYNDYGGSFRLSATSSGGSGGGGGSRSFITWTGSSNGYYVKDANNEDFAFYSDTGCLYSFNMNQETSNFCITSGYVANFAGQTVHVLSVAGSGGGCIAALADPYGRQVDIYTSGGIQYVSVGSSYWDTTGCTY